MWSRDFNSSSAAKGRHSVAPSVESCLALRDDPLTLIQSYHTYVEREATDGVRATRKPAAHSG